MLYFLSGNLVVKREGFAVIDTGGVAFKVFTSAGVLGNLPNPGASVKLYTYLHVREDALELYGFDNLQALELFERLNSVSGIGPKSALGILGVASVPQLIAAINENRVELLTRASGIGRKTAERAILELKGKLTPVASQETLTLMESNLELEETLVSLGYSKTQAKAAVAKIDPSIKSFKDRLKEALKRAKPSS